MHEIIHVVDAETATGTVRQDLEIEAVNDCPLSTGYYFVLWPTKARPSRNRSKRYFGPFATRIEARLLLTSALALGLAQNEDVTQTVAECRSIVRCAQAANDCHAKQRQRPWRAETAYAVC